MIAQARSEEQQRLAALRASGSSSKAAAAGDPNEGYLAYMQRQIQERTEKLNIMGDGMQNLEENSAGWASDVNKFVSQQKKNAITGRKCIPSSPCSRRQLTNISLQSEVWPLRPLHHGFMQVV